MILCDKDLKKLGSQLLEPFDEALVNPASIDIRIGNYIYYEDYQISLVEGHKLNKRSFTRHDISDHTLTNPFYLRSKQFILAETLEKIKVPNGYSIELKLKSSRAREGYDHSLAFWFDPGWVGIGTLELSNNLQYNSIPIYPGLKIGQIIVHQNTGPSEKPYQGKYLNASCVEVSKDGANSIPAEGDW